MRILGHILGALWSLPITAVGLVLALVYRAGGFELRNGILICEVNRVIGGTGAQTFALVQFYRRGIKPPHTTRPRDDARLRVHETTHTLQAMVLGLIWAALYVAEYVLIQLPWFAISGRRELRPDGKLNPLWKTAYRSVTWERWARYREKNPDAWGSK